MLLPCCGMKTEHLVRQRILRLTDKGVSQKVIAARMGISTSKLSRWLGRNKPRKGKSARTTPQPEPPPLSVPAMDGFDLYRRELLYALLVDDEAVSSREAVAQLLSAAMGSEPDVLQMARQFLLDARDPALVPAVTQSDEHTRSGHVAKGRKTGGTR